MMFDNHMQSTPGRAALLSGRSLSGLAVAFLTLDAAIKLIPLSVVT